MKKEVKQYGDTLIINFNVEEQRVYNIEEGDIIDISDLVVIKKKRGKNGDKK